MWNINGLQSAGRSANAMDKMHRNGRYLILVTSIIIIVTQKCLNELWIKWKTSLQRDFLISITVRHQGRDREFDRDMVISTNIHTHVCGLKSGQKFQYEILLSHYRVSVNCFLFKMDFSRMDRIGVRELDDFDLISSDRSVRDAYMKSSLHTIIRINRKNNNEKLPQSCAAPYIHMYFR